ncbi:hypothetical protein [Mucilaginibacter celer]|uniref:Outer membrane protein beta-barrel domain-containing protein n=1 Tax=Mucilaginibacter celer TaxID=2305508 RepID=A0A494W022_9SPHI|nr:hypothetical protein [Mucilaginibacter celer]AYL96785.1 hypothetical protein HYN43_016410 [Mucilaginibacter celer]
MKLLFYFCLLGTAITISSCTDHLYAPALYHSDIAYLPKPLVSDTAKSSTYISGGIVQDFSPDYSNDLVSGQLNLSRGHAFDHFNLAYGAFGSFGNDHNRNLQPNGPYYFKNKFFGAVGGRLSGNATISTDKVEYRIIGFEGAYSHEFGDYLNFRRAVTDKPKFYTDTRADLFTLGATTEMIFKSRRRGNQFGFRFFWGGTFGDKGYSNKSSDYVYRIENPGMMTAAYFMQIKNYIAIVEGGSYWQFRLGYRFK